MHRPLLARGSGEDECCARTTVKTVELTLTRGRQGAIAVQRWLPRQRYRRRNRTLHFRQALRHFFPENTLVEIGNLPVLEQSSAEIERSHPSLC